MRSWLRALAAELRLMARHAWREMSGRNSPQPPPDHMTIAWGAIAGCAVLFIVLIVAARAPRFHVTPPPAPDHAAATKVDLTVPVRDEPGRFKPNSYMPRKREDIASGPCNPQVFFPKYDLVAVEDARVWWESDHDVSGGEDDHIVHRRLEEPLRRLIELASRQGGKLKVHDAYRPEGVHALRSLHKEGRAVDVTSDDIPLEKLAKLCWAAGFDWVYFEAPRAGGAHIHCSVRADR